VLHVPADLRAQRAADVEAAGAGLDPLDRAGQAQSIAEGERAVLADSFASYKADYSNKQCPNHGAEGCVMRHAKRSGCQPTTKVTFTKGKVSCKTYQGCPGSGEATLCTVTGGGHTWPGGEGWFLGGALNKDIVASQMVLDFFFKYRLP
jgi:poly(3-hydroxybutyrate) depolymerase